MKCPHCGGDRFVVVTEGPNLYDETYAPCAQCNPDCNTKRYTVKGERLETAAR